MKRIIKMSRNGLKHMISESVRRILKENDYKNLKAQADEAIYNMNQQGYDGYGWRDVAEQMGVDTETISYEDEEILKDAIEDAMIDNFNPQVDDNFDDELNMVAESKLNRIIRNVIKEHLSPEELHDLADTPSLTDPLGYDDEYEEDEDDVIDWQTL